METKKTTETWQLSSHWEWMMDQWDIESRKILLYDLQLRMEIEKCQIETRVADCMGCAYYHRRCGGGRKD